MRSVKRPLVLLAAGLALVLGACAAPTAETPTPPAEVTPASTEAPAPAEPPIPDWMADQPVPAFLDAEQQALFLRAYSAASFLMGCSTSGVDSYPLDGGDPPELGDYETVTLDSGWTYLVAQGRYARWEDFATRLDRPLAQFIQLYQPAFFERIGLRYVNAVSRQRLGLEGELWDDLIRSQYIGILGEPDVEESEIAKCSLDVETPLVGDYRMKLHAGPGLIGGGKTDKEVKFILDGDFSTAGKHNPDAVPEKLERMHRFAVCLFQGAITKELHEAMGPTPLAE